MSDEKTVLRREVLKRAVYVVPAIVTLSVAPAMAGKGSKHHGDDDDN